MNTLDGQVAIVTGGARGQGRAHAVALAGEGAAVVVADIADQIDTVPYEMASEKDLKETVSIVQGTGGTCVGVRCDIRDTDQVDALVKQTVDQFGRVDILVANAGICGYRRFPEISDQIWEDMIDVNLSGTFKCLRAVVPHMVDRQYGRIIITSSGAGRAGAPNIAHYSATKWGLIGLGKTVALETAGTGVTVNIICPTTVNTPMVTNSQNYRLFCPELEDPQLDDALPRFGTLNPMNRPWLEPEEVARAVLYFATDKEGYLSGTVLEVSMGASALRPS